MKSVVASVLAVNGGSSSIRFAIYGADKALSRLVAGKIDRIGSSGTSFTVDGPTEAPPITRRLTTRGHRDAIGFLLDLA